jgi:hypothetical protein
MRLNRPPKLLASFLITFILLTVHFGMFDKQPAVKVATLTGGRAERTAAKPESLKFENGSFGRFIDHRSGIRDFLQSFDAARAPATYTGAPDELLLFINDVQNGESDTIRGVFVENIFALPIIQQPEGDISFVSPDNHIITEFRSATAYGVTGLLAHNYLSGDLFYKLETGQEITIVFGDGKIRRYQIEGYSQFQRVEPSNLRSRFIDLSNEDDLTSDQVFDRFYRGSHRVTFQTCLARYGVSNWGLTFFTALPIDLKPIVALP